MRGTGISRGLEWFCTQLGALSGEEGGSCGGSAWECRLSWGDSCTSNNGRSDSWCGREEGMMKGIWDLPSDGSEKGSSALSHCRVCPARADGAAELQVDVGPARSARCFHTLQNIPGKLLRGQNLLFVGSELAGNRERGTVGPSHHWVNPRDRRSL